MADPSDQEDLAQRATEKNPEAGAGSLRSFFLAGKSIRCVILDGSDLIRETQKRQQLNQGESIILGQALLACALMAASLKGLDEIGLRIDCSGLIKGLIAEATASGEVRAYLKQRPIPHSSDIWSIEDISPLTPLWEEGLLTITRYLEEGRQPFSGSVTLQSGDIGAEISHYYQYSEQIPTTLRLFLRADASGTISRAGGLLLQAMPNADLNLFNELKQRVSTLPHLSQALVEGQSVTPWLLEQFVTFKPEILAKKTILMHCRCNQQRMSRLLLHLSLVDLEDMRDNGPFPIQTTCHFCNRNYSFAQQDLAALCEEKQRS